MSSFARLASVGAIVKAVAPALRPGGPSLGERAGAVPRLVRATLSGEYTGVTKGRLAADARRDRLHHLARRPHPRGRVPDPRGRRRRAWCSAGWRRGSSRRPRASWSGSGPRPGCRRTRHPGAVGHLGRRPPGRPPGPRSSGSASARTQTVRGDVVPEPRASRRSTPTARARARPAVHRRPRRCCVRPQDPGGPRRRTAGAAKRGAMTADITLRGPGDVARRPALPARLPPARQRRRGLPPRPAGRASSRAPTCRPRSTRATVVDGLVGPLLRDGATSVIVVGYEDEPDASQPSLIALVERLERAGVDVLDVVGGARRPALLADLLGAVLPTGRGGAARPGGRPGRGRVRRAGTVTAARPATRSSPSSRPTPRGSGEWRMPSPSGPGCRVAGGVGRRLAAGPATRPGEPPPSRGAPPGGRRSWPTLAARPRRHRVARRSRRVARPGSAAAGGASTVTSWR